MQYLRPQPHSHDAQDDRKPGQALFAIGEDRAQTKAGGNERSITTFCRLI
jgi:hypothetical protein